MTVASDQVSVTEWLLDQSPALVVLTLLVVALVRGWLVPGKAHDQLEVRCDRQDQALAALTGATDKLADSVESLTEATAATHGLLDALDRELRGT